MMEIKSYLNFNVGKKNFYRDIFLDAYNIFGDSKYNLYYNHEENCFYEANSLQLSKISVEGYLRLLLSIWSDRDSKEAMLYTYVLNYIIDSMEDKNNFSQFINILNGKQ